VKFGYQQASHSFPNQLIFEALTDFAKEAENLDFDSFWIMDHLVQIGYVGSVTEPILESYTTLGALAYVTSKIKLGALCTCSFFRNPALLAKMGATLDQISKGRFWLGLGAGWFQEEAIEYGYRFENHRQRLEVLGETLQIVTKAWTEDHPTFHGKYHSIEHLDLYPKPSQRPRPLILVGGEGERVTLRLVAQYADACNFFSSGEDLDRKLQVLKNYCKDYRRNYSEIIKTKLASVVFANNLEEAKERIMHYKPAGVDFESYSRSFVYGDPDQVIEQIERLESQGIEYLIINFRGTPELSQIQKFAKEIKNSF
jgi:F420-dependent oxidoreductase-like protein